MSNYKLSLTGKQIDDVLTSVYNGDYATYNQAKKVVILGADGYIENNQVIFATSEADTVTIQPLLMNLHSILLDLHLALSGTIDSSLPVKIKVGETIYNLFDYAFPETNITIGKLSQSLKQDDTGFRYILNTVFSTSDESSGFAITYGLNKNDIMSLTGAELEKYVTNGGINDKQLAICTAAQGNYTVGHIYQFNISYPLSFAWKDLTSTSTTTDAGLYEFDATNGGVDSSNSIFGHALTPLATVKITNQDFINWIVDGLDNHKLTGGHIIDVFGNTGTTRVLNVPFSGIMADNSGNKTYAAMIQGVNEYNSLDFYQIMITKTSADEITVECQYGGTIDRFYFTALYKINETKLNEGNSYQTDDLIFYSAGEYLVGLVIDASSVTYGGKTVASKSSSGEWVWETNAYKYIRIQCNNSLSGIARLYDEILDASNSTGTSDSHISAEEYTTNIEEEK